MDSDRFLFHFQSYHRIIFWVLQHLFPFIQQI